LVGSHANVNDSTTIRRISARGMNRLMILLQLGLRRAVAGYYGDPVGIRTFPNLGLSAATGPMAAPLTTLRRPLNLIVFPRD
jgi:hypothetical protein